MHFPFKYVYRETRKFSFLNNIRIFAHQHTEQHFIAFTDVQLLASYAPLGRRSDDARFRFFTGLRHPVSGPEEAL